VIIFSPFPLPAAPRTTSTPDDLDHIVLLEQEFPQAFLLWQGSQSVINKM